MPAPSCHCRHTLRKPRPFSQPVTNLLSISIPLQPLNDNVIQSIMTPPPPRSPPTPTTTRLTTVSNISFTRQYFFRFRFPTLFTQLLPFIFNTELPFIFVMAQLLSTNQINPNKSISNKSFPTNPFSTISDLPRYQVSLLFQVEFPTLFRTNVITQIISGLLPCPDFILFIAY